MAKSRIRMENGVKMAPNVVTFKCLTAVVIPAPSRWFSRRELDVNRRQEYPGTR